MNSGIYLIKNLDNGKVYVGQTNNLRKRSTSHFWHLRLGNHQNKHLQSAYIKYGKINFEFIELELCELDALNEREVYWINHYGGINSKLNYNQSTGGKSNVKRSDLVKSKMNKSKIGVPITEQHRMNIINGSRRLKHTIEHKEKMSNLFKGRLLNAETKRKISETKKGVKMAESVKIKLIGRGNIPISQFSKDGILLKEFPSAKTAGQELGISKSDITQVSLGKRKSAGGFIFKYTSL